MDKLEQAMRAQFHHREHSIASRDPGVFASRRDVCATVGDALGRTGQVLQTAGQVVGPDRVSGASPFGNGDDAVVGLGRLARVGATLCEGAVQLLDQGNLYAAAALIRQMVEVEYLCWAFADDHAEAASWLRSTKDERLERWQPRHIRDRAGDRFRAQDYGLHCELGGHPTPMGVRALLDALPRMPGDLHAEMALHATSSWLYVLDAAAALDVSQCIEDSVKIEVQRCVTAWQELDGAMRAHTNTRVS